MKTINLDQTIKLPSIQTLKETLSKKNPKKVNSSIERSRIFNAEEKNHERDYIGWENYNNYKYKSYNKSEVKFLNNILFKSRNHTLTNPLNVYLKQSKRDISPNPNFSQNLSTPNVSILKPRKLPTIESNQSNLTEKIKLWLDNNDHQKRMKLKQNEKNKVQKSKMFTSVDEEIITNNRTIRGIISKYTKEVKPCKGLRIKTKEEFNKAIIKDYPEFKGKRDEEIFITLEVLKQWFDQNIKSFTDELLFKILYIHGVKGTINENMKISIENNRSIGWMIFSRIKYHFIERKSSILESLTFICTVKLIILFSSLIFFLKER